MGFLKEIYGFNEMPERETGTFVPTALQACATGQRRIKL